MPTTTGIATTFIDFTRASNATTTDSDGKVKWAPHNLLLASESFNAWNTASGVVAPPTVTANNVVAPNGTQTADRIAIPAVSGTNANSIIFQYLTQVFSTPHTFGVYLRGDVGGEVVWIGWTPDGVSYARTQCTLTTSWQLFTVNYTTSASGTQVHLIGVDLRDASQSAKGAQTIYAWGAAVYRSDLGGMQANTSAYPLYNPTTPKNLLGFTESLTTGWTNSNTTDAIVSEVNPVGLTGAVDVAATAGNGTLLSSLSLLASPYTFSVWLKRKTGSGTVEITVDGTTYVAAAVTGTWTRFSTTLTPTAGTKTPGIRLVTSGDAVYAWGAQLSDSASLDSYVPVYGAAVTSAAYYGPRRDFDPVTLACKGLLVEEQRANTIVGSANFSGGGTGWVLDGASLTASATAGPDGSLSATSIVQGTGGNRTYQFDNSSVTGSKVFSIYVKPNAGASLSIYTAGGMSPTGPAVINATTGAITGFTGASSVAVGNGWYRVFLPVTVTVASGNGTYWVISGPASSVFIWGTQLEAGTFATSYIPTPTAATATRLADVASVSTQAFPYSATEGTLVANGSPFVSTVGTWQVIAELGTGGNQNVFELYKIGNTTNGSLQIVSGGVESYIALSNAFPANAASKIGGVYKANDFQAAANGTLGTPVTSGAVPAAASNLYLGKYGGNNSVQWNGHIRQITYLPRRISNADLVTRST